MIAGPTRNLDNHVYDIKDGHGNPISVLKGAILFGANGSGKSNLFKAIRFSTKFIIRDRPDFESTNYYVIDPSYADKPSSFEYEFEMEGHTYRYGFEIVLSTKKVVSEYLSEIFVDGNDTLIFSRGENGSCVLDNERYDVDRTALFIHNGRQKDFYMKGGKHGLLHQVCDWFFYTMATLAPDSSLLYNYDFDKEENIEEMGKLLSRFDTGITGMGFFPWKEGEEKLEAEHNCRVRTGSKIQRSKNVIFKEEGPYNTDRFVLRCVHGDSKTPVRSDQESDGTKRLWNLSPILLRDDYEFVYVIDELDRYLHPKLVYRFIEWFMKKDFTTPKQIIGVSHNTHLLDQNLLRRDEIWFVDKDPVGATRLCSLDDYNVRFDKKIEKAYLEGNFRGLPNIVLPGDLDDD